jgi:hypothetical protein
MIENLCPLPIDAYPKKSFRSGRKAKLKPYEHFAGIYKDPNALEELKELAGKEVTISWVWDFGYSYEIKENKHFEFLHTDFEEANR